MLQHSEGQADVGPLASLRDHAVGQRYCAWRGASDRRYVTSIYPVSPELPDAGLPSFENYVLMAVARRGEGRRVLGVSSIERARDGTAAIARARTSGADEWHVHFLTETTQARAAAVTDIARRHLTANQ